MFFAKFDPPTRRMESDTNMSAAREEFLSKNNYICWRLVQSRYEWMNEWIQDSDKVIYEIGCGVGAGKEFIRSSYLQLTDVLDNPWVDKYLDAMNMDDVIPDESVDVFICCNVLHHFAQPYKFLKQAGRKLKPHGRIIFFEPYTSVFLRLAQRILGLEGWDETANVFDPTTICNNPNEPWSANNSIPKLLFKNKAQFEQTFPEFSMNYYEVTECLLFLLSGGVNYKVWHPNFTEKACGRLIKIDKCLTKVCPELFALGCRSVIEKKT